MQLHKSKQNEAILSFLKQDEVLNLNMLGILKSKPDADIYVDDLTAPTGVYILSNEYFAFLYTKNLAFVDAVCEQFMTEGYHGFSGVESSLAEYILSHYEEDWKNPCTLYYMPEENLNPSLQKTAAMPLDPKWTQKVDENYPYRGSRSIDEITDNLTRRPSSAIFIDGEPVCWVMLHDDYSMGIMHTMDDHRRKGYAVDVTIDLCRRLIEQNEIPFLQIVETNQQSPGLALKCGFVPYAQVTWFGVKVGDPLDPE